MNAKLDTEIDQLLAVLHARKLAELFPGEANLYLRNQYLRAYRGRAMVPLWAAAGIARKATPTLVDRRCTGRQFKRSVSDRLRERGLLVKSDNERCLSIKALDLLP